MKRESGWNRVVPRRQAVIPAQLRARFKGGLHSRRQTAGKYGVASRGATLLTLTLSCFAAHRAPVLHRPPPTFGV